MKFLSILFCAMSVTAFAQQQNSNSLYTRMTSHMKPQVRQILEQQMTSAPGQHKTTGNKQRLVGYSSYDTQNALNDSTYFGYSGNRGSSFANCLENLQSFNGAYSKPDTVWRYDHNGPIDDTRYTYDNKDSLISLSDTAGHYRYVYTRDLAGNPTRIDVYDTSSGQPDNRTIYLGFDNQNRPLFDSTYQTSKSHYGYGQGIDSMIAYIWNSNTSMFDPYYKSVRLYNNAGLVIKEYDFYPGASNSWDSAYRASYSYNGNGFLTLTLWENYDDANLVWTNGSQEILGYTGNHPLYSSYEASYFVPGSGWVGSDKYICKTNSAGNWDTVYLSAWNNNTNAWDSSSRIDLNYNSFDYITNVAFHDYNGSGFDPNPYETEHYYYRTYYVPDAVTNIHTPSPEITAYPNPVSGKLHIDGNIGNKNVSMQLISITGSRLFNTSGNWQSMNKDIDMSPFAGGVYYLLIIDENGNKIAAKQIVKN